MKWRLLSCRNDGGIVCVLCDGGVKLMVEVSHHPRLLDPTLTSPHPRILELNPVLQLNCIVTRGNPKEIPRKSQGRILDPMLDPNPHWLDPATLKKDPL